MMTREETLSKLAKRNNPQKIALITGDEFSDVLQERITQLKEATGEGIHINNLDDLLDILSTIQAFHKEVTELKDIAKDIKGISFPDSVAISGLGELKEVLKRLPTDTKIVNKINNTNVVDEYQVANGDEQDDTNNYYGFVHSSGKWYILWISGGITSAAYKYSVGPNDYIKAWGGRKKLNYSRFDEVTL